MRRAARSRSRKQKPPGHQGIEIGLCRLYQVTGDKRWLALAQFLLVVRGVHETRPSWGEYCQDHVPVLQQKEAVGHAVRAAYMYAGMADVAALTGDERWAEAIDVLWDDVVRRKLYVTGGGSGGTVAVFGHPSAEPIVRRIAGSRLVLRADPPTGRPVFVTEEIEW